MSRTVFVLVDGDIESWDDIISVHATRESAERAIAESNERLRQFAESVGGPAPDSRHGRLRIDEVPFVEG